MKIQVKFDVPRICEQLLIDKLDSLSIKYAVDTFGEVEILQPLTSEKRKLLTDILNNNGIEIVNDHQMVIVLKVKEIISRIIKNDKKHSTNTVRQKIESELPYTYSYVSQVFSKVTHTTIEQFKILRKIDYVKELLVKQKMSLTEIAYKLNYSSTAHLCAQFKKTTGFTPSAFLNLKEQLAIKK